LYFEILVFKPLLAEDLLVLQSLKDSLCSTGDTVPTLGVSNIALQGSLLMIIFPKGQCGFTLTDFRFCHHSTHYKFFVQLFSESSSVNNQGILPFKDFGSCGFVNGSTLDG